MFCKICGNELHEKAVACPKCGCAVEVVDSIKKEVKVSGNNLAINILNYITVGLTCLAIMFFALSIVTASIYTWESTYYFDSYMRLNSGFLIFCFIFSLFSLGASITSFIICFKKENVDKRFISISLFIVSVCVFFVAIYSCGLYLF